MKKKRMRYSYIFQFMKATHAICLGWILLSGVVVFAQDINKKISVQFNNTSLQDACTSIEKQTAFNFSYSETTLQAYGKNITFALSNATVKAVLSRIFDKTPVTYTIKGKMVYLVPDPDYKAISVAPAGQAPQSITVEGRILNADDSSVVSNATLVNDREKVIGISDAKGHFSITIASNTVLGFSSIGFERLEQRFSQNQQGITIRLKPSASQLSGVVVTSLGIKRQGRSLGYAVTKIDNEQLTDAVSNNWLDALSGKVAGLNMIRSNSGPAGSIKVILRGENNLTGENEALIVVDGVVISSGSGRRTATGGNAAGPSDGVQPTDFGSGLNDINPEDIESVTVLKGPAASALYGQRGANGAIIITTKSGSAKRKTIGISLTSNGSMESVNRWPDLQYEYGQGLNGEAYYSYGNSVDGVSNGNTSVAWGAPFNGQSFFQYDPVTQTTGSQRTPWVPYKNALKEFFETGRTLTNSLSVDGKIKDHTDWRVSASYGKNDWILPNTGYNRTNASLSLNSKITSKLNLSVKANYTNRTSDNLPGVGYGNQSVMYWYVFWVPNADINWLRNYWVTGKENEQLQDIFTTAPENPYAVSYEFINGSKRNGITGNVQLSYNFTKELSLMVRGTIDRTDEDRWQHRPWSAYSLPKGSYRTQDIVSQEITGDFMLKYDKKFNEDFRLTTSIGGSNLKNHYYKGEKRADGLTIPNVYSFDNAANAIVSIPDTSRFEINSMYGLLSASYKNWLFLDVTGRQDWSSVLATPYRKDNVGFFYPSASVSFLASDLFKLPRPVTFLKLRLSAAQVGSGGTTPYRTAYLYNLAANGTYADSSLTNPAMIPNPNLKPLKTTSYEVGAEVKLFDNRLGFDIALYSGNTKNQILERIVDRSSGYTRQLINAGQIDNKGIELSVNFTPVKLKNFRWTTYMTYAANRNKIVKLSGDDTAVVLRTGAVGGTQIVAKVGGSMGDMYGIGFKRAPDGQVVYSSTGIPELTTTPVYLGNTMPKFRASLGNEFTYKQFRLNVLFDAQYGAVAHSYTYARLADFGKLEATVPGRYSGIKGHGVIENSDGTYRPNDVTVIGGELLRSSFYPNMMGTPNGEGATYKTDFIKLREARFEYSFPAKTLKKVKLSKLTLGIYGRNLFTWSTWPLFDPEFGTLSGTDIVQGLEVGQFPSTRTYGFNLTIGIN
ncbi:SusC/RagA family TonB-linked outer membrane protein [Niastella yeongjuensis]|nr:SusC/RagA family TonB-linked outer membrane protein [Niastella yeongjuensis]SEO51254.1 TonB-linked outer membrane protein, SusC/RagA family [Niastella yeongjuensis]